MTKLMKKEELIRRLERTEIPELLVQAHREHLRRVLLQAARPGMAGGSRRQAGPIQNGLSAFWNWFRVPAWRAYAASAAAIFLIAAVLAVTFYIISPSPAVVAANVVKNDPRIQQTLSGSGEIIIVRVEVRDNMANVVCGRGMGDFVEAQVDVVDRYVVSTRRFEGIFLPELPLQAQDTAVKIARSDPRVKDSLDKGGTIGKVFPIVTSISSITIVDGNLVKVTPVSSEAIVPVYRDGKTMLVQVDLDGQKTERIIEPQFLIYFDPYLIQKL